VAICLPALLGARRPACNGSGNPPSRALVDNTGLPGTPTIKTLAEFATEDYILGRQNDLPSPASYPWIYYGDEDSLVYIWHAIPLNPADFSFPLAQAPFVAAGNLVPGNLNAAGINIFIPRRDPLTTGASTVRHYDRGACSYFMTWPMVGAHLSASFDLLLPTLTATHASTGNPLQIFADGSWRIQPNVRTSVLPGGSNHIYQTPATPPLADSTTDRLTYTRHYWFWDSIAGLQERFRFRIEGRVYTDLGAGGALNIFESSVEILHDTNPTQPSFLTPVTASMLANTIRTQFRTVLRNYWASRRGTLQLPPTARRHQMYPSGIEEIEAETVGDPNFPLVGLASQRCAAGRILPTGFQPVGPEWHTNGTNPTFVNGISP